MDVSFLPAVNATLNGLAAILLAVGFVLIKQGNREAHRKVMLAAFGTSAVFLACYLVYHALHGSTSFPHQGWIRPVYFVILITHIILAALVLPFTIATLVFGIKGRFDRHRKLARVVWPVWMYVSVTGVVIYLMLYHL